MRDKTTRFATRPPDPLQVRRIRDSTAKFATGFEKPTARNLKLPVGEADPP